MEDATEQELCELPKLIREVQKLLRLVLNPEGFNVGMNFGRCAGAGLVGHMHTHIVPRWVGDTNYMPVCGDTDIISQSLAELFGQLKQISDENGLPVL